MAHICPWWLTYTFDHPVRRLLVDPVRELAPYVGAAARALDIGCGFGFHSVALCEILGPEGSLVLVDVQRQMLDRAVPRCARVSGAPDVSTILVAGGRMPLEGQFDFALMYWSLHEVEEQAALWENLSVHLAPAGCVLVAEPKIHISRKFLHQELDLARAAGFHAEEIPSNLLSHRAILRPSTQPRSE